MIQVSLRNNIVDGVADETILLPGYIDITGVYPVPEKGWIYDTETGMFSVPPIRCYLRIQTSKRELVNDGIDYISVVITLYDKKRVLIPVNRKGRIILRDDRNNIYDLLWFQLVNGTVSFDYTTTGSTAIVHIDDCDNYIEDIGGNLYMISSFIDEADTLQIGREV